MEAINVINVIVYALIIVWVCLGITVTRYKSGHIKNVSMSLTPVFVGVVWYFLS